MQWLINSSYERPMVWQDSCISTEHYNETKYCAFQYHLTELQEMYGFGMLATLWPQHFFS